MSNGFIYQSGLCPGLQLVPQCVGSYLLCSRHHGAKLKTRLMVSYVR